MIRFSFRRAVALVCLVTFIDVGLRAANDGDSDDDDSVLSEIPILQTNPSSITNVKMLDPEELRKQSSSFKKMIIGHKDLHDTINEQLMKKLPDNDNIDDNFDLVAELADLETKKPLDDVDDGLQLALYELADLRGIYGMSGFTEGRRCTHDEFIKLAKNDRLTKGRARVPILTSDYSRVDYLVHIAMNNHALECYPVYIKRFSKLVREYSKRALEQINKFVEVVTHVAYMKFLSEENFDLQVNLDDPNDLIRIIGSIGDELLAQYIREMLELFAIAYPIDKDPEKSIAWPSEEDTISVRQSKMDRLIDWHLVKPCLDYTTFFGPDLFEPFAFDNVILDKQLDTDKTVDEVEKDFFKNYMNYSLCRMFMTGNLTLLRDAILQDMSKESEALQK